MVRDNVLVVVPPYVMWFLYTGANEWGFEIAIGKAMPHCKIHTVDCTVDGVVPPEIRGMATFHKICIGTRDETVKRCDRKEKRSWRGTEMMRMMKYSTFAASIGLTEPPDVLKMDIEVGPTISWPQPLFSCMRID